MDDGQVNGAAVNGTNNGSGTLNGNNGPYYDSNATPPLPPQLPLSTPPGFFDSPHYYAGVGTYLHFDAIAVCGYVYAGPRRQPGNGRHVYRRLWIVLGPTRSSPSPRRSSCWGFGLIGISDLRLAT